MRKMLMIIALMAFVGVQAASAQKTLHVADDIGYGTYSTIGHISGFNYGVGASGSEFLATFDSYPPDATNIHGVSVYVTGITGNMYNGTQNFIYSDEFGYDWAGVGTNIADWNNYDYVLVSYALEYDTPNGSVSEWHDVYYEYY